MVCQRISLICILTGISSLKELKGKEKLAWQRDKFKKIAATYQISIIPFPLSGITNNFILFSIEKKNAIVLIV